MKLVLLLNYKKFIYDTYEDLCNDWEYIVDNCGYSGTGGDWRHYSLVIHGLHSEIEKDKPAHIWKSWWKVFNPTIAIAYATDTYAQHL